MDRERITALTTDQIEHLLATAEAGIARLRGLQAQLLEEVDRRQVPTSDGCRTLSEWVAARLDVSADTARQLVCVTRRVCDLPELGEALAAGEVSFDRVAVVAGFPRIPYPGGAVEGSKRWDVEGLRRVAARCRRITRRQEHQSGQGQFVVMQPDLGDTTWKLNGRLSSLNGAIVEQALTTRGDQLFSGESERGWRGERMAAGLVALSQDTLTHPHPTHPTTSNSDPTSNSDTGNGGLGGTLTVIFDGELLTATGGEAGGEVVGGPRVGPAVLEQLLCTGSVEILTQLQGKVVRVAASRQAIPPAVRRYVLWRDAGRCTVDGCNSRYRIQPHHIKPRSEGGTNHPENLTCLCWFHHHWKIHQQGYVITPDSQPGRVRLQGPATPRSPLP